ncbi:MULTISPECIES: hypothetical protein [Pedobacter]|uniref:hypothetical protein n=1 Tax=Pedobacter TaxID=84567 RepID=UPI001E4F0B25|nr:MULTISPECIES: hypothetical protein [Pedobacter]
MENSNFNIEPVQNTEIIPQPKRKNRAKTVIWIIVAIIVIAGATGFAYLYGGYKMRQDYYNSGDSTSYPADSVFVDGWASPEDFATWKGATFTIPQYNDIPIAFQRAIVKIFMDNNYFSKDNNDLYFFTKIKDRAYRVIAYGDFTGQGEKEMAFLLEKSDYASSAIYIIPQKGNILYWKELSGELPTIKSFKKGALIFMDKMELTPAPSDGIIKQTKNSKYVLIYNRQTKTFDQYYQYTNEDIKSANEETDEGEEEADEPDSATVAEL